MDLGRQRLEFRTCDIALKRKTSPPSRPCVRHDRHHTTNVSYQWLVVVRTKLRSRGVLGRNGLQRGLGVEGFGKDKLARTQGFDLLATSAYSATLTTLVHQTCPPALCDRLKLTSKPRRNRWVWVPPQNTSSGPQNHSAAHRHTGDHY